jgi:hypothetical protein
MFVTVPFYHAEQARPCKAASKGPLIAAKQKKGGQTRVKKKYPML